ncbi:hypothetical protein EPO05_01700 [Patescibacteria group bacterium]|nr:MAG: hypothetical protein EPO05_01700 [Patescibacteria group bacterium]
MKRILPFLSGALMFPGLASAADIIVKNTPTDDYYRTIGNVLTYFLAVIGIVSVIGIAVSGVLYLTAGGDEKRVERAKSWIVYTVAALVVTLIGYVILKLVSRSIINS